ncbi:hypothetical protein [Paenibacillus chitinolyticus]|uniref:hypothetical protein n=1 Tax=Paenibacillus chitinolyticus TaxID=79263 RepID=UPI00364E2B98
MKKKRRKGQQEAWMADQVFQHESPSKRMLAVSKSSMLFAGMLYVVLLVIGLLASIGSWNGNHLLEAQLFLVPFCFGVFVLGVIFGFRRGKKSFQPEQMCFESGVLRFRLGGEEVELASSCILGVNQHYRRNRDGNIITWLAEYEVFTADGVYHIDLSSYERNNGAGNWLLHCNRERNAEKVRQWQAAEQAFRTSDKVTFGTKWQPVVLEQQPPSIRLGKKQLNLSAISRIVIDPTVSGRGRSNLCISFLQHHDPKKPIALLPCRVVADEWNSFLQHLFAIAKRVNIPVELKVEERRDVSQVPSWW